jgi:hypothetical protein
LFQNLRLRFRYFRVFLSPVNLLGRRITDNWDIGIFTWRWCNKRLLDEVI